MTAEELADEEWGPVKEKSKKAKKGKGKKGKKDEDEEEEEEKKEEESKPGTLETIHIFMLSNVGCISSRYSCPSFGISPIEGCW